MCLIIDQALIAVGGRRAQVQRAPCEEELCSAAPLHPESPRPSLPPCLPAASSSSSWGCSWRWSLPAARKPGAASSRGRRVSSQWLCFWSWWPLLLWSTGSGVRRKWKMSRRWCVSRTSRRLSRPMATKGDT